MRNERTKRINQFKIQELKDLPPLEKEQVVTLDETGEEDDRIIVNSNKTRARLVKIDLI